MRYGYWIKVALVISTAYMEGCDDKEHFSNYVKHPRVIRNLGMNDTTTESEISDSDGQISTIKPIVVNPVMSQKYSTCSGNGLGLYSWNHLSWKSAQSKMLGFLIEQREFACGDIYVNIADYSGPDNFPMIYNLVPFIQNVRASGNTGVVYLTYGDINVNGNGVLDGPRRFVDAFFDWFNTINPETLQSILPVGMSFDCEHLPRSIIETTLTHAQRLKASVLSTKLGDDPSKLIIQWTVEGARSPENTDTIMKLADSAIIMAYRNHEGPSPNIDPAGHDTLSTRFLNYMMRHQCERCLDDAYAEAHYKAKVKLMIESDCECPDNCRKTSFCAFDTLKPGWGDNFSSPIEYLKSTLRETKNRVTETLTTDQQIRLFGKALSTDMNDLSLFVVHNWEWFNCYFGEGAVQGRDEDQDDGGHRVMCKDYPTLANVCREAMNNLR